MTDENQEKRHIKTIMERIDYLTGRIANAPEKSVSHLRRERSALRWALAKIDVGE